MKRFTMIRQGMFEQYITVIAADRNEADEIYDAIGEFDYSGDPRVEIGPMVTASVDEEEWEDWDGEEIG